MELRVGIAGRNYEADLSRPKSLTIPLMFDGAQPGFFGAPNASAAPYKGEGFIGDTSLGGSCNVSEIRLVPHCNGTHTENFGHIVHTDLPVWLSLGQALMPARVISVSPGDHSGTGDLTIARADLAQAIAGQDFDDIDALIIRTVPNSPSKKSMTYDDSHRPPYIAEDAMSLIVETDIRHLLVDFPSIDKMHDHGMLANHRLFWAVAAGSKEAAPDTRTDKTITEMIFVDDSVEDGLYLLDLQVPVWDSDAAPSNPVLYPLKDIA